MSLYKSLEAYVSKYILCPKNYVGQIIYFICLELTADLFDITFTFVCHFTAWPD